uniref:Uncharacterized protein n=1 Tax=Inoviridae sp. ctDEu7 TaxID=2826759 RepID=A0A8S5MUG3_9VIRU|nr:MAG TPA: hypothetical protein [Inoviridae sp. ctDEu7]
MNIIMKYSLVKLLANVIIIVILTISLVNTANILA